MLMPPRLLQTLRSTLALCAFAASTSLLAQAAKTTPAEAFDTASIRLSAPDSNDFSITPNPNSFHVTGANLKYLVQYAYDLEDFQVEGGPPWTRTQRFDITAKADPANTPAASSKLLEDRLQVTRARMQSLLAERFHLQIHRETKLLPGYTLLLAKGGPKMDPPKPEGGYSTGRGSLSAKDFGMDDIASLLSTVLGRTVVDKTGNTSRFSFTLKWATEEQSNADGAPPALFTALQEQLGLRLEATKFPTPLVVMDSVTQPSAN